MNSVIHREKTTIIVTRACREIKLRTIDDVMDFVGNGAERWQVLRLWDEIQREAKRAARRPGKRTSEARLTLDDKDRAALATVAAGQKVPQGHGPRIGRLKRLGYIADNGKLTPKGRREVMQ